MFHERTKHIDVRLHFVRDINSQGIIKEDKISTLINPANMPTKSIPVSKFEKALNLSGVLPTYSLDDCKSLVFLHYQFQSQGGVC